MTTSRPTTLAALAGALVAGLAPHVGSTVRAQDPPGVHLAFERLDARVHGNGWLVPGVSGQALQLDGIAAHVVVPAAAVPPLAGSFTVEGWVALGAYPFNDAPLLQQRTRAPPASSSASATAARSASTSPRAAARASGSSR